MFGIGKPKKSRVLVEVAPVQVDDQGRVDPKSISYTQEMVAIEELEPTVQASVERALRDK